MLPFLVILMLQPLSGQLGPLGCGSQKIRNWDTGSVYPSTVTDLTDRSTVWVTPSKAQLKDTDPTVATFTGSETSNTLRAVGFGITLPHDAIIRGIIVGADVIPGAAFEFTFQLVSGGVAIGSPKTEPYYLGETGVITGDTDDLWLPAGLTRAMIIAPGFGFEVTVTNTDAEPETCSIDALSLTVFYRSKHKP